VLEHGAPVLREIAGRELSRFQSIGLDLRSVTELDARGVGVIAELCQAARNAGRVLVLTGVNERVLRLFRLTRLDKLLTEPIGGDPSGSIQAERARAIV
jgi:anti-sigma B factor antagonist